MVKVCGKSNSGHNNVNNYLNNDANACYTNSNT